MLQFIIKNRINATIYYERSTGYWYKRKYDKNYNLISLEDSFKLKLDYYV